MHSQQSNKLYVYEDEKWSEGDEFFIFKKLASQDQLKIHFNRQFFAEKFGSDLIRNYSKQSILLLHIVDLCQLKSLRNQDSNIAIVSAVSEADFEFKPDVNQNNFKDVFGLRQYLISTPAFLPHLISNFYGLNASIQTCGSTVQGIFNSLQLAELELIENKIVLVIGGNLSDISEPSKCEMVFSIFTNSLAAVREILINLETSTDDNLFKNNNLQEKIRQSLKAMERKF